MKRIDPLLAMEEDAELFLWFRERRLRTMAVPEWLIVLATLRNLAIMLVLLIILVFLLSVVAGTFRWVSMPNLTPLVILCVLMLPSLLLIGSGKRRGHRAGNWQLRSGGRFPHRLSDALGVLFVRSDVVTDLWLSGATGRDIALALYLERRQATLLPARIVVTLVTAITFFCGAMLPAETLPKVLFLLATLGVGASLFRYYSFQLMIRTLLHLQMRVRLWRFATFAARPMASDRIPTFSSTERGLRGFYGILSSGFFLVLFSMFFARSMVPESYANLALLAGTALFGSASGIFFVMPSKERAQFFRFGLAVLEDANEAWVYLVRNQVLQDDRSGEPRSAEEALMRELNEFLETRKRSAEQAETAGDKK
jgi:hypothetical protein